jgi:hypothetical protein
MRPYDEFVDFLVETVSPESLAKYSPSAALQNRAAELANREGSSGLPDDERRELEQFRTVEAIVSLVKTRMRQRLISE